MSSAEDELRLKTRQLEYAKLVGENSWRGWALPVASAVVGAVSIFIAGLNFYTDLRKDKQDHALACVNFAQNMLTVAQQQEAKIATLDQTERGEYVANLLSQFPPDAAAYLGQDLVMDKVIESGDILNTISDTLNSGSGRSGEDVDCPSVGKPLNAMLAAAKPN